MLVRALLIGLVFVATGGFCNQRASYIAEGTEAEPNEFPWLVSIQERASRAGKWPPKFVHRCGGSIINDEWILTAAHCFSRPRNDSVWRVIAGAHNLKQDEATQQKFDVDTIIMHQNFNRTERQNDIALAKIVGRFNFSSRAARAIFLAKRRSAREKFENDDCVVAGWGLMTDGRRSDVVQKIFVPIIKPNICELFFNEFLPEKHLCSGRIDTTFHTSTCEGDFGGPLACFNNGTYKLAGILSRSSPECPNSYPDVFVRVSFYRDWIEEFVSVVDIAEPLDYVVISCLSFAFVTSLAMFIRSCGM